MNEWNFLSVAVALGHPSSQERIHSEGRGLHAQGFQQIFPHGLGEGLTGLKLDDPAQEVVVQIGITVKGLGWSGEIVLMKVPHQLPQGLMIILPHALAEKTREPRMLGEKRTKGDVLAPLEPALDGKAPKGMVEGIVQAQLSLFRKLE